MIVRELIEELQAMDPDAMVAVIDMDGYYQTLVEVRPEESTDVWDINDSKWHRDVKAMVIY